MCVRRNCVGRTCVSRCGSHHRFSQARTSPAVPRPRPGAPRSARARASMARACGSSARARASMAPRPRFFGPALRSTPSGAGPCAWIRSDTPRRSGSQPHVGPQKGGVPGVPGGVSSVNSQGSRMSCRRRWASSSSGTKRTAGSGRSVCLRPVGLVQSRTPGASLSDGPGGVVFHRVVSAAEVGEVAWQVGPPWAWSMVWSRSQRQTGWRQPGKRQRSSRARRKRSRAGLGR